MIRFAPDAVSDIERLRAFLDLRNPDAARRAMSTIWSALEQLDRFSELGRPTDDPDIRQLVIRFGAAGYIVRYTVSAGNRDIVVLRIWHGREART